MGTETHTKATPRVVKLKKGLKLAEAWVNNMSESASGEPSQIDSVDRPSRLGLGARAIAPPRSAASTDPAERKLLGKLKASKRNQERENTVEEGESSEEDGDEPESRAKAFVKKKRSVPWATSSLPNKK